MGKHCWDLGNATHTGARREFPLRKLKRLDEIVEPVALVFRLFSCQTTREQTPARVGARPGRIHRLFDLCKPRHRHPGFPPRQFHLAATELRVALTVRTKSFLPHRQPDHLKLTSAELASEGPVFIICRCGFFRVRE